MSISEDKEQIALVNWLKINKFLFFSVPNGGTRNQREAQLLKKTGLVAGVSDLVIFLTNHILFLELKVRPKVLKSGKLSYTNSKVSDEQKIFLARARSYDYALSEVAYGYEDAIEIIERLNT